MDLYLKDTDNAEMLMHFTDLPVSDSKAPPTPPTEDEKSLTSFCLAALLDEESKERLDRQLVMRGALFQAALCYALEWVAVSYWRMGTYPAQVLAGTAASQWTGYAGWCARKGIADPLTGRLVDVLGRIWAWKEEPYIKRLAAAQSATERAQADANYTACQLDLFDRKV